MSPPSGHPADPSDFLDPLEVYDSKPYDDPLQQALADEPVAAIKSTPYASVPPTTTVGEAIRQLASLHVACLLVEKDGQLVGVFSDRDVLDKVALNYNKIKDHPLSEVMSREPIFVYETDSSAAVLAVMAVSGYRHVPILNADKKIVGIASPQRVTEFLQRYFKS